MGVIKEKIEMAKKLLDIIYLKTITIITELLNRRSRKGEGLYQNKFDTIR